MNFDFYKYHALGNDYIVIDPNKTKVNLSEENIRLICHRNFGVGSDGILYGPLFQDKSIYFRILNPDGSEAEKSGNGIRIFSRFLVDAEYVTDKEFNLGTLGGNVRVELLDDNGRRIRVDMGTVTFQSRQIPVAGPAREVVNEELVVNNQRLFITCLSIGNPHCVVPCDELGRETASGLGAAIESHELFPNRINVQFLKILNRNNIQIEIWERGAGYTLASGSSSCAAASAAYKMGLAGNEINVHMPGGIIRVDIQNDGHVFMTGSVTQVAQGVFSEDLWRQIQG
ncbi:MAG TPA: diaminopimelate epimerase [Methylomusa anaerophila]|uniref:Diaminopimelate epimerase n=1 Tax=Methylomusa anaerophila TaxID=1930071 RepID=A0A348AM85_9FIRM|nr:diaminopimelate epimerase [Methylomusa anaerophila]BBB92183.1 diaminopimelate epimerase [Methylomusa anaerophila]HML87803.1 diaminopimelate epimerase [Methylomusa anaerophila]